MGLIIDASVVVKWFIDESDSEAAHLILDRDEVLLAPDLLVVEVCNTAWRRSRIGDISQAQCPCDCRSGPEDARYAAAHGSAGSGGGIHCSGSRSRHL